MSATESSVGRPAPGWGRRFPRDEKVFLVIILATTIAMTAFAIGWVIWGSQNVPTATSAHVTNADAKAHHRKRAPGRSIGRD